jgi:hypothetical protein
VQGVAFQEYAAVSIAASVIPIVISYALVKPIVADKSEIETCEKKGQFKRSLRTFQSFAIISAVFTILSSLIILVVKKKHSKPGVSFSEFRDALTTAYRVCSVLKSSSVIAMVMSGMIAYTTFRQCDGTVDYDKIMPK